MFWRPLGIVLITIALAGAAACSNDTQPPSTATPAPSPDGGRPTQLSATSQPATQPPSGGIVFAIGGSLWRVNTDASGLRRLVGANGAPLSDASAPEFSPDGRLLAYVEAHHFDRGRGRRSSTSSGRGLPNRPVRQRSADADRCRQQRHRPVRRALVARRHAAARDAAAHRRQRLHRRDTDGARRQRTAHRARCGPPGVVVPGSDVVGKPRARPAAAVDRRRQWRRRDHRRGVRPAGQPRCRRCIRRRRAFTNVATHQNPAGEGVLVASSLGSPEPFGPIVVYDIAGASSIVGGGCGAAWSPDGMWLSYYDGYGIAVQRLDAASPDDHVYAARNAGVGLDASRQPANACDGVAITWRRERVYRFAGLTAGGHGRGTRWRARPRRYGCYLAGTSGTSTNSPRTSRPASTSATKSKTARFQSCGW